MGLFGKKSKGTDDTKLFITQSVNGMKAQQQANVALWHLNHPQGRWDVDMQTGKVIFTHPEKTATADMQIVGTLYNGTFLWGWDHPSVPAPLRHAAQLAKKWGEEKKLEEYTQKEVPASEDKAWEFTAVAARLAKSAGTYRGRNGDAWVYMVFGPVSLIKR
jgi:hypothetical protein